MMFRSSVYCLGLLVLATLSGCADCGGSVATDGGSTLQDSGHSICVSSVQCPVGWNCEGGTCVEPKLCSSDLDCPGQRCNLLSGECGGSTQDGGPSDAGATDGGMDGGADGGADGGGSDGGSDGGPPKACTPLETRCSADQASLETCAADGSAFSSQLCAAPTPTCFSGACVACQPGSASCNGSQSSVCRSDGSGVDDTDCALGGQACVGGACQLCAPGSQQCKDAITSQTCNSTGTAYLDTACNSGSCDSATGSCVVQVCTPGQPATCQGDQLMQCNAQGTGLELAQDCTLSASTCVAGACVSLCQKAVAENSYIGCEYWPVVLSNSGLDTSFKGQFAVVVSNPNTMAANVSITNATGAVVAQSAVPPGQLVTLTLPWNSLDIKQGNAVNSNQRSVTRKGAIAYKLVSTVPVTAYQFNPITSKLNAPCTDDPTSNPCYSYSNDASLLLPAHVYGDAAASPASTYLAMSMPHARLHVDLVCKDFLGSDTVVDNADLDQPAFVAVVATAPGTTTVTFNPRGAVAAGDGVASPIPAGQLTTFTLNQYEVLELASAPDASTPVQSQSTRGPLGTDLNCFLGEYYFNDTNQEWSSSDLTGSVITSDKPVAVYGGADCRFMPYNAWACDHMEQQLFPFSNWSHEYVGVHAKPTGTSDPGEQWRVVAAANGTTVSFTPASACTVCPGGQTSLNAGDKLVFQTAADFVVTSQDDAHPIMIAQFFVGQDATGSSVGDPTMILAVPTAQYRNDYAFLTPSTIAQDYVNLVRPTGADVSLDGALVTPGGGWTPIVGTTWEVARVAITDGTHHLSATAGVGLTVYGYDSYVSYGYPGGLDLKTLVIISPGG